MNKQEFAKQYDIVFKNNVVTNCGRKECRKLINLAKEIDKNNDYDDELTGFMNIENIQKLRNQLKMFL